MTFTNSFFFLHLLFFASCGFSAGAQEEKISGINFVDSAGFSKEGHSVLSGRPFYVYKAEPGTKLKDLHERGFQVVRQLSSRQYIVRPEEGRKGTENTRLSPGAGTLYPANNNWKLSPPLLSRQGPDYARQRAIFFIKVSREGMIKAKTALGNLGAELVSEYELAGLLQLRCTYHTLFSKILPLPVVTFIGEAFLEVKEESLLQNVNLAVNKINLLHHFQPQLNGAGINISVKEQKFNPADIDLRGRYIATAQEAESVSKHATEMATIMAGAGNSSPKSKGVAWAASLASSAYQELFPDPESYFTSNNISVQNHSYGTAIENFYGATAHAYDVQTSENPALVHVFSAGNDGQAGDTSGAYKGVAGFANLTGNFKMAKNVLVVGALDSLNAPDKFVSRGPAHDGRLKPEVVAYSAGGSSNAAALVTGVVSLLQQAYLEKMDSLPPSALVKALLINSAEDTGPSGIDFFSGYGNVHAEKAHKTLIQDHFFEGFLEHGQERAFSFTVPANMLNLKLSLVWNDPAAEPNAARALVNDLDFELVHAHSGSSWLPWVLSAYPHPDSLQLPPKRATDHLNTAEQISLQNPEEGEYILKVKGFDIPAGPQDFFIVYEWEEADYFRWTYPAGSDNLPHLGEGKSVFRWESTYKDEKGVLEISLDKGQSWELIDEGTDLAAESFTWNAPDILSTAIARMKVGQEVFRTQPFTISRPLRPSVGFNCSDSLMLSWKAVAGAETYQVFTLQSGRYLEVVANISDTFFIFQKADFPEKYFAVAPVPAEGETGIRSATFDYAQQGVDCYLAFFNVRAEEEGVHLALQLGTTYQVEKVHFERSLNGSFIPFHTIEDRESSSINFLDPEARQGVNEYRARLELANGQELLTEPALVYFLTELPFIVFPNPVSRNEDLHVFSKDFEGEKVFLEIYNLPGQIVMERELISERDPVSVEDLGPGMYFYILRSGRIRRSGKIYVY